jgi:hypothetical protein
VVRSALGIPSRAISTLDLRNLTRLSASDRQCRNLSGLEWAANLRHLDLSWNPLTNSAALLNLTNLLNLRLEHANIHDLTFTSNLTQLISLTVSDNKLTRIEPLSSLTNLCSLDFRQNQLQYIDPITNLVQLQALDMRWNLLNTSSLPVLNELRQNGVSVLANPQRESPYIDIQTNWLAPADLLSALPFSVLDSGPSDEQLSVNAEVYSGDLVIGLEQAAAIPADQFWWLWLTNPPGTEVLHQVLVSATNDVGLSSTKLVCLTTVPLLKADAGVLDSEGLTWTTNGSAGWFGQTFIAVTMPDITNHSAAQSGAIGNNQTSVLQTTVTGPGKIAFWWRVSSETNRDYLEFVQTNYSIRISGEVDWQERTVNVPEGPQTLLWRYSKDPSHSSGLDAGWVDQVRYEHGAFPPQITLRPTDQVVNLGSTAAFSVDAVGPEPLDYQWYFNYTNQLLGEVSQVLTIPGVVDTQGGDYVVMVYNGFATSCVASLTVNHFPVPAAIELQRYPSVGVKVRTSALLGSDPDGNMLSLVSVGAPDSHSARTEIHGGWVLYAPSAEFFTNDFFPFTIRDDLGATSTGTAAVAVLAIPASLHLEVERLSNGGVRLVSSCIPGRTYLVQYTTDEKGNTVWQNLGTSRADEFGIFTFEDTPAEGSPERYYRILEQ